MIRQLNNNVVNATKKILKVRGNTLFVMKILKELSIEDITCIETIKRIGDGDDEPNQEGFDFVYDCVYKVHRTVDEEAESLAYGVDFCELLEEGAKLLGII